MVKDILYIIFIACFPGSVVAMSYFFYLATTRALDRAEARRSKIAIPFMAKKGDD